MDDVPYRLGVFVQMAGVLLIAAGVPRAFESLDFTVTTAGYTLMRVGLVAGWLRAVLSDPPRRATALRYAAGVTLCQLGWLAALALPTQGWVGLGLVVLFPAELLVPVWAERAAPTTWHPHHIAERYGLLALVVLGESVLSASGAFQAALDAGAQGAALARRSAPRLGASLPRCSQTPSSSDDGCPRGRGPSAVLAEGREHRSPR